MSKISVEKRDHYRAILTDALPYETPMIFSNEGLYNYKKAHGDLDWSNSDGSVICFINKFLTPSNFTIPFKYKIKATGKKRTLSVIHPKFQLQVAEIYEKFGEQILYLCSTSPVSLRHPVRIGSYFYEEGMDKEEPNIKNWLVEQDNLGQQGQNKFSSSYFSYQKYNLIHKFFSSSEYIKLETKYNNLLFFDISRCFSSIYTHSIAWAIKDKTFSKNHRNQYSFEAVFDTFMQKSNYNETNGIVVGPEISRIFAEIILQRIDKKVIDTVESETEYRLEVDYTIRRYVDDFFIFYNDKKVSDTVFNAYMNELEHFNLHINDAKTARYEIPFSTPLTNAKAECRDFLDQILGGRKDSLSEEIGRSSYKTSRKVIEKIKRILKQNSVNYEGMSGLILGSFNTSLLRYLEQYESNSQDNDFSEKNIKNVIFFYIETMFFIYMMDIRVRSTFLISQAMVLICSKIVGWPKNLSDEIKKLLLDKSSHVFKVMSSRGEVFTAELQNLLISLTVLGDDFLLSAAQLETEILSFGKIENYNYFQIISILYYIRDHKQYKDILKTIEDEILNKFNTRNHDISMSAELTMLMFDTISCPYITSITKSEIATLALKEVNGAKSKVSEFIKEVSRSWWFVDWANTIDLAYMLYKKELKTPY